MCLAVPGRIEAIYETFGARMGSMDFGGIKKEVCLAYVPEAEVGQYAIVHVGFAISLIDEASAAETLRTFQELGILEEELGLAEPEPPH
ncbi:MAG TPA: HypC/HybG/HupF family hydrogenase formation chaperone [Thermoanaerobaculia bacterium]|nr:HypC/HybG/HupF family hydrogenase formation chaperone [Thermoanaerobaculia bacterium]